MFVGHYGPSFAGKAFDKDNRVPLWLLFIAVQFIDVLWGIFVLLGVEKVRIVPSLPSSPLDLYYMPYTHSLVGALGWSLLAFVLCQLLPRLRGAQRMDRGRRRLLSLGSRSHCAPSRPVSLRQRFQDGLGAVELSGSGVHPGDAGLVRRRRALRQEPSAQRQALGLCGRARIVRRIHSA